MPLLFSSASAGSEGIVYRPHAALQPVNPFRRVPLQQPPHLHVSAPCELEQDLSSSCEEVAGSQLPTAPVYQGSRPGLGSAGPWHSLGADIWCLDGAVISPARLRCLCSVSAGECQLRGCCGLGGWQRLRWPKLRGSELTRSMVGSAQAVCFSDLGCLLQLFMTVRLIPAQFWHDT